MYLVRAGDRYLPTQFDNHLKGEERAIEDVIKGTVINGIY